MQSVSLQTTGRTLSVNNIKLSYHDHNLINNNSYSDWSRFMKLMKDLTHVVNTTVVLLLTVSVR